MALSLDSLSRIEPARRWVADRTALRRREHRSACRCNRCAAGRARRSASRRPARRAPLARPPGGFGGAAPHRLRRQRNVRGRVGQPHHLAAWVLLGLFTVNFAWIAVSFTSAIIGFVLVLPRSAAAWASTRRRCRRLATRTAVVMPIYNEASARVMAGLQAIRESVDATGLGRHFDFFIVSATPPTRTSGSPRSAPSWRCASACPGVRALLPPPPQEHRPQGRQHRRLGAALGRRLPHMLVLDADSLMTGDSHRPPGRRHGARSRRRHHPDPADDHQPQHAVRPRAAIRARVYGPVIAAGIAWWHGADGNYWGHNAIIRTRAFAAAGGLAILRIRDGVGDLCSSSSDDANDDHHRDSQHRRRMRRWI